jgi:hypothetical protein
MVECGGTAPGEVLKDESVAMIVECEVIGA